jgi:GDP-mannose 6-dehydrogenase
MNISIFGMGYVGVVSAACLARDGHRVTGIDIAEAKVADLNAGRSPIQEPGVEQILRQVHAAGLLRATTNPREGLGQVDLVWICVGTPSTRDGSPSTKALESVCRAIGEWLAATQERPCLAVRSTVLPGTTHDKLIPIIEEHSGLAVGEDIDVAFHPEFLREGSAVHDFDHPPKIVIGEASPGAGERLDALYGPAYVAPRFRLTLAEAEMVKYCDNLYHALKITFANEIGAVARTSNIDARRVADVFCADTKLNISAQYLRPGFAFGGSCLPKDLRAILRYGVVQSIETPMLEGILRSNELQIERFISRVLAKRPKHVGFVGLAFKPDTDDMRESPFVRVAKSLIGEGVRLSIFDPAVQTDRLVGSNKEAVHAALRHLETLLVPDPQNLRDCDVIVINHASIDASIVNGWLAEGKTVFDLADIKGVDHAADRYEGIAW